MTLDMEWINQYFLPVFHWIGQLLTPEEWGDFGIVLLMTYAMSYFVNALANALKYHNPALMRLGVFVWGAIAVYIQWPANAPTVSQAGVAIVAGFMSIVFYHLAILALRLLPSWMGRDKLILLMKGTVDRRIERELDPEKERRK